MTWKGIGLVYSTCLRLLSSQNGISICHLQESKQSDRPSIRYHKSNLSKIVFSGCKTALTPHKGILQLVTALHAAHFPTANCNISLLTENTHKKSNSRYNTVQCRSADRTCCQIVSHHSLYHTHHKAVCYRGVCAVECTRQRDPGLTPCPHSIVYP